MSFRGEFLKGGHLGHFIHFGPYSAIGRGEQVLWRERLDQARYRQRALNWKPHSLNMEEWIQPAIDMGADYAVLTTRHHDSYCLWPTAEHSYHSFSCFQRDIVQEFVDTCRNKQLKVGLYYSLADWTNQAYFNGPSVDQSAFTDYVDQVFRQVTELLTNYGPIDIIWFDACSPHNSEAWRSEELIALIRSLHPDILINSRLEIDVQKGPQQEHFNGGIGPGDSDRYGDYSIGEGRVLSHLQRPWETCAPSTRRRWGYTAGEAWRPAAEIAEEFITVMSHGGNYMLNVGPDGNGLLPIGYQQLQAELAPWLKKHRHLIQDTQPFNDLSFDHYGWLLQDDNRLRAVLRIWDESGEIAFADFDEAPVTAELHGFAGKLWIETVGERFVIKGLPTQKPHTLFPVLELHFANAPRASATIARRAWSQDLAQWQPFAQWATEGVKNAS